MAAAAMAAAGIAESRVTVRRDWRRPVIPTETKLSRSGRAGETARPGRQSPVLSGGLLDQDIAQVEGLAGLDGEFPTDLGDGLATHGVIDEPIGGAGDQDGKRETVARPSASGTSSFA